MSTKRILAVGDAESLAEIRSILRRSVFEMQRVPAALAAAQMVSRIPFDLMIVVYPLVDSDLAGLHRRVRATGSASRDCQLLVLAPAARLPELDEFHQDSRLEAVDLDQPQHRLAEVAARYLGPIRVAERYPVRLPAVWPTTGERQTVDVSASGVLIELASGPLPPLGERGELELGATPAPPIRLVAEVARHADTAAGGVRGFAVTWIGAAGGELERLEELLADYAG